MSHLSRPVIFPTESSPDALPSTVRQKSKQSHTIVVVPLAAYSAFVAVNKLRDKDFAAWQFMPGMLFGDDYAWWAGRKRRPASHEGVDFRNFVDRGGNTVSLTEDMLIPVAEEGKLLQIFNDFLGQSALVAHDLFRANKQLHSIYAHINVDENLCPGESLAAGQIIGTIAASYRLVPPHLHLSYLWLPRSFKASFAWEAAMGIPGINFVDPLGVIGF